MGRGSAVAAECAAISFKFYLFPSAQGLGRQPGCRLQESQFVRLKRRDIINVAQINCQARAKVKLVPNKLLLKMKCPILRAK